MNKIILPDIGEGISEVTITDVLVTDNQKIKKNDVLIIVESEKASMEIPSTMEGKISEVKINSGDTISPGDTIAIINVEKSDTENNTIPKNEIENKKEIVKEVKDDKETFNKDIVKETKDNDTNSLKKTPEEKAINEIEELTYHASPSVRKLARELGADLSKIQGSGRRGRITKNDIYNSIKDSTSSSIKDINENEHEQNDQIFNSLSRWGVAEKVELNNIKKVTAKRLHTAWTEIPHVTQFDEIDITELDKIRIQLKNINKDPKIKVSLIPFFMKAIVKILKDLPIFNSSLSDDRKSLIYRKYFNIGIAADTPRGLVVPVIKNVDQKSIKKLSHELTKIIYKSKEKRLSPNDMSGGCITISSLGSLGGKFFTPIINPPEVAILGISKFEIKPKLINNKFVPRKILPISLSYDHRVIDGADAVRFTKLFADIISKPNLLINGK
tara:strand:+ start:1340 stop:2668 length:1329 start_codon:yes stop_codon:yes gene_type:complete